VPSGICPPTYIGLPLIKLCCCVGGFHRHRCCPPATRVRTATQTRAGRRDNQRLRGLTTHDLGSYIRRIDKQMYRGVLHYMYIPPFELAFVVSRLIRHGSGSSSRVNAQAQVLTASQISCLQVDRTLGRCVKWREYSIDCARYVTII